MSDETTPNNTGADQDVAQESESSAKQSLIEKINNYLLRFSKVPIKEKLFFVQHLGVMLKAGISLSVALKTLSEQTENKRFQSILKDAHASVENGVTFSEALKKHKNVFGELFINMIEAGELSGKLEGVLQQLYIQMKKNHELISKVKGALTYPAVIVLAMGGISIFMVVFIVPKITGMFSELNAELPLPTKILIGISNAIVNNGILATLTFILVVGLFFKTISTPKGKKYFQYLLLKMPIISPIIKKINLARFSRTVSSLLKTDIMIVKTFQITANVLGNLHYREAIIDISEKIQKGDPISKTINLYPTLFTPVVATMISVGEETGELDSILMELADFYEGEVNDVMNNLPAIIEPLLILFLGVGVGGMAVAIIMPMYSLSSAI